MDKAQKKLDSIYTPAQARLVPPLSLAWIGDSLYSTEVRKYLLFHQGGKIDALNRASIPYVSAAGQARSLQGIREVLSEEEAQIVRHARNVKSRSPKNQTVQDYHLATGLEALFGYLSLTGQESRLKELMALSIEEIGKHTT